MNFFCFLALCLIGAHAMHLDSTSSPLHFQTDDQKQAYIDALMRIQKQLADDIHKLQVSVADNNEKINKLEDYPTPQARLLEEVTSQERDALQEIESELRLPLKEKVWECKNLTQEEVDAIHQEITTTQKKLKDLEQKLNGEEKCVRNQEVEEQIHFLNLYLSHLLEQLANRCSKEISSKVFYVVNSGAQNVIYGQGKTKEDYLKGIQQKLDQGYSSIQCVSSTPFPQEDSCVSCPEEAYYDLGRSKCLGCEEGYWFDITQRSCIIKPFNSDPSAENYSGQKPKGNPLYDSCPSWSPFFNGYECVSCEFPSYFDYDDHKCKTCAKGMKFDESIHSCSYIKYNSITPSNPNFCCGEFPHNQSLQNCTEDAPYFNGKICIQCSKPSYFNLDTMNCDFCPDGKGFSFKSQGCVDSKYLAPFYKSNLGEENQNYYGTPPKINEAYENILLCEQESPFSNGENCLRCPLPSYFNFESQKCEKCRSDEKFDTNLKKCVHKDTTKFNSNMDAINDNFKGKVPNYDPNFATCPRDKPFFNGYECTQCNSPYYIDFDVQQCKECDWNKYFDLFNRQCVMKNPAYYTDLEADNIFYNGDWNDVVRRVEQQKRQHPQMRQCQKNIPYYNAEEDKCITCPGDYPLFDYKYNRCISCTGDSYYDQKRRICRQPGHVSPTIERMIMNTVGWI